MAAGAGWRDVVRDAVTTRAAEVATRNRAASDKIRISRVGFAPLVHPFVVRAARQRNISLAGYIRRATLALAAMDLGMEVEELLELDAAVTMFGNGGAKPSKDLDGKRHGLWRVRPR